jgi:hypothetical protein
MRRILTILMLAIVPAVHADDKMVLYTPAGVYECVVTSSGPGEWVLVYDARGADISVKGFGGDIGKPDPPTDPDEPDPADPVVQKVADISKDVLKDDNDATAVFAIVETVAANTPSNRFVEALRLAMGIADGSLDADGRLEEWLRQVSAVTSDPAKMMSGLRVAFDVDRDAVQAVYNAVEAGDEEVKGSQLFGLDIAGLLAVIRLVMELLDKLSDIWG